MSHALEMEADLGRSAEHVDFDDFFRRNVDRARRMAWRLVGGDEAAAADVVQEAFLKAHRGLAKFRGESELDTWFYRIVVNEAASYRRLGWVRRWIGGPGKDSESGAPTGALGDRSVPAQATDPPLRRRIGAALEQLSRGQREAFVLVHLEKHTVREAAQLMGVGEGSAKKHLHRALVRLREQLADLREE